MIAPMPSSVRFHAPSTRLRVCVPVSAASLWSTAILLVDHRPMGDSPGVYTGKGGESSARWWGHTDRIVVLGLYAIEKVGRAARALSNVRHRSVGAANSPGHRRSSWRRSCGSYRSPAGPSLQGIIRCFPCDRHVVRMRFAQTGRGDAYEFGARAQLFDGGAAHVAHAAAHAADHLIKHVADGTLVRHASLDPLGHELPERKLAVLEVAVAASVLHRRQRTHAAHHLETSPLEQKRLARTLFGAGEHRPHHHARGPGGTEERPGD